MYLRVSLVYNENFKEEIMKKLIALMMVLVLIFTACGENKDISTSQEVKPSIENHSVLSVTYPESVGFDNYDAHQDVRKNNPVKEETLNAISDFSGKTAAMLLSDTTTNQNYSPISLYFALAIAANGADGDTQQEILNLLGINDIE